MAGGHPNDPEKQPEEKPQKVTLEGKECSRWKDSVPLRVPVTDGESDRREMKAPDAKGQVSVCLNPSCDLAGHCKQVTGWSHSPKRRNTPACLPTSLGSRTARASLSGSLPRYSIERPDESEAPASCPSRSPSCDRCPADVDVDPRGGCVRSVGNSVLSLQLS